MSRSLTARAILFACALIFAGRAASQEDAPKQFVVGGGTPFGYYFGLAGAVCAALNGRNDPKFRCLNVANSDSSTNLREVDEGLIDFAFVQSDWLYRASRGEGRYRSTGPNSELRSILSVHAGTPLTATALAVLAHPNAGAKAITQLAGRHIGYDAPNSYSYLLMRAAVEAARIDVLDSAPNSEANANITSQICRGRIDAMVTVERHPSAFLAGLIGQCGLTLVSLDQPVINQALTGRPDLTPFRIKAGSYPGLETDIDTFGLMAVLVTQSSASIPLIEAVMKALFETGSNKASPS
ncbi:MAG: TAXI family TRAP transporter solute-binding subunit, partial [Pseudomonadota bacterium]|nr:TAXI family TRAP transporter solute-binding subunit [Pseudomonadota bacterium]